MKRFNFIVLFVVLLSLSVSAGNIVGGNISDSGTTKDFWQVDANKETGVTLTTDHEGGAILQNNKKAAREMTTLNVTDLLLTDAKTSLLAELKARPIKGVANTGTLELNIDANGILTGNAKGSTAVYFKDILGKADDNANLLSKFVFIESRINDKADKTELNALADIVATKADEVELEALTTIVAGKADQVNTYTKTEIDGLILPKADKVYVDQELNKKADKTALDAFKIKDAANSSTTDININDGVLTVNVKATSGLVKSVNNKLPDVNGAVQVFGNEIKRTSDAGSKNVTESIDALESGKEDAVNKVQDVGTGSDKQYPSTAAAMKYTNSTVTAAVADLKAWIGTQLEPYAKGADVDSKLALKANDADVYKKTETYARTETYNRTELDAEFAKKANESGFNDRVQGIVNSMSLNASKIATYPVDITGIKQGQGIQLDLANNKWIPANLGGESKYLEYKKEYKMEYNDSVIISSKDIPALKAGNFRLQIRDEEIPDIGQYAICINGGADNASAELYAWDYMTYDGGDVVRELRITKVSGWTGQKTNTIISLQVYTGTTVDIPLKATTASAPGKVGTIAHIKGSANIIDEKGAHEFGAIYRNGNDVDILQAASIPIEWRKTKPVPGTVTINKDREIVYVGHPGFVRGKPVLRMAYTNCTGTQLQPGKSYFVNVSIGYASRANGKKIGDVTVKQYSDYINWSGRPDEPGDFTVTFSDIIDCRDMNGVLTVKLAIVPLNGTNETMDLTSAKLLWMPVIERELTAIKKPIKKPVQKKTTKKFKKAA